MQKAIYSGVEVEVLKIYGKDRAEIKVDGKDSKSGEWFIKDIGLYALNNRNVYDRNVIPKVVYSYCADCGKEFEGESYPDECNQCKDGGSIYA